MGQPAAKKGDRVVGIDIHIVMVPPPAPGPLVPTPLPHPFAGILDDGLSGDVSIMGQPAATVASMASNQPAHMPTAPGTAFQKQPSNKATVKVGSSSVRINGKAAARAGDSADTCNDPADLPAGTVMAVGSVLIG